MGTATIGNDIKGVGAVQRSGKVPYATVMENSVLTQHALRCLATILGEQVRYLLNGGRTMSVRRNMNLQAPRHNVYLAVIIELIIYTDASESSEHFHEKPFKDV